MKAKFLDADNILTTLKALSVGIVTGLITCIPMFFGGFLILRGYNYLGMIMYFISLLIYLFTWGFLAKKWWGW